MKNIYIIILSLIFISCQKIDKKTIWNEDFIGKWINENGKGVIFVSKDNFMIDVIKTPKDKSFQGYIIYEVNKKVKNTFYLTRVSNRYRGGHFTGEFKNKPMKIVLKQKVLHTSFSEESGETVYTKESFTSEFKNDVNEQLKLVLKSYVGQFGYEYKEIKTEQED